MRREAIAAENYVRKGLCAFSSSFCVKAGRKGYSAMAKENEFQKQLIGKLRKRFTGCIVSKLDSSQIQGIPDLLVLYKDKWATLECKRSENASKRPNQEYYVNKMNDMSFSRFISPENEREVLDEMERAFKS